jgi:hypothetical protein
VDKWHSVAEQKIQEALEQGKFKNLSGRGRPLKLDRNPFEPPDLRLAHMVLEGAGMSPAWIDERKELDRAVEELRAQRSLHHEQFRARAQELNRRIRNFNLNVPSGSFQLRQMDVDRESTLMVDPDSAAVKPLS